MIAAVAGRTCILLLLFAALAVCCKADQLSETVRFQVDTEGLSAADVHLRRALQSSLVDRTFGMTGGPKKPTSAQFKNSRTNFPKRLLLATSPFRSGVVTPKAPKAPRFSSSSSGPAPRKVLLL